MVLILVILSGIILVLTWAFFVPPIQYLWQRKDSRGISSVYLLLNLLCATEHVFFSASDMVYLWAMSNLNPPLVSVSPLNWLNLAQLSGVWVLSNVFFVLCLYYSQPTRRRRHRRLRILLPFAIYLFFLLFTIVPLALDLTTDIFCPPSDPHGCPLQKRDIIPLLRGIHSFYLLPIITILLPVLGFYKQAQLQRERRRQQQQRTVTPPPPTTTSIPPTSTPDLNLFLARPRLFQAAVFFLSAVLWVFRVDPWWQLWRQPPTADPSQPAPPPAQQHWLSLCLVWWVVVGYVAVDDAIFAIGQVGLGYLGVREAVAQERKKGDDDDDDNDPERRPLLVVSEERSSYVSEN